MVEVGTLVLLALKLVERVRQGEGLLGDKVVVEWLGVGGLGHLLRVVVGLPRLVALPLPPEGRHGPAGLLLVGQGDLNKAGGWVWPGGGDGGECGGVQHLTKPLIIISANSLSGVRTHLALLAVLLQDARYQPGDGVSAHVLQLEAGERLGVVQQLVRRLAGQGWQHSAWA